MGRGQDVLRLVRAPLAPTAASDAVACALLARGPGLSRGAAPLDLRDAGLLAATSLLVYAAGMAGNDLADLRRDRTIAPDRPLPAGRLSRGTAIVVIALAAGGALALGGGPAGSVLPVAVALAAALLYDLLHARFPRGTAPLMGLVRFSNAATGAWPLVAAGTASPLALLGPALLGLYSAGVTVLSTAEGRPQVPTARALFARAAALVAFAGGAALAVLGAGGWAFGLFLGLGVCASVLFGRVPRPGPVKRQVLEMLLGLYWLDAVLATGGAPGDAWVLALGALLVAFALVVLSQLAIRALRPR